MSLTGFSLVGGPAYNDSPGAAAMLASLDVPYIAAQALEFQTLEQWEDSERGLLPVEATMMVAIPELDGATAPMVFGGRSSRAAEGSSRDIVAHAERVERLADRVERLIRLRKTQLAERKVAIVLFNFPPNGGSTGTAAFLGVYESLHRTLIAMRARGYRVEVPASVDALRERILDGNAKRYGAGANVAAKIPADDHIRREPFLREIEAQWGPAPGRLNTDGASLFILGERFGNVLVAVQPAFGFEGDPMRLLFERGFAPTHAFSAFYRYLREDFAADVILNFGTHGALEFMPGKQAGLSAACWPERLIGAVPNVYLYAANNPSEGALAKRRTASTLVSYLTPSLAQAGLYRGLLDLKASLDRFRICEPDAAAERRDLTALIQSQAVAIDLAAADPAWGADALAQIDRLNSGDHRSGIHADPPWPACRRRPAERRGTQGNLGGDRRGLPSGAGRRPSGRGDRRRRRCRRRDAFGHAGADGGAARDPDADRGHESPVGARTTSCRRCCARSTAATSRRSRAAI